MIDLVAQDRDALPGYHWIMSPADPAHKHEEPVEVIALRKAARGEPLTEHERAALDAATPKPASPGTPHAAVEAELQERKRRGA